MSALAWLIDLDPVVLAGCIVGTFAFLIALPGLIVRLGKTEDGAQ